MRSSFLQLSGCIHWLGTNQISVFSDLGWNTCDDKFFFFGGFPLLIFLKQVDFYCESCPTLFKLNFILEKVNRWAG